MRAVEQRQAFRVAALVLHVLLSAPRSPTSTLLPVLFFIPSVSKSAYLVTSRVILSLSRWWFTAMKYLSAVLLTKGGSNQPMFTVLALARTLALSELYHPMLNRGHN